MLEHVTRRQRLVRTVKLVIGALALALTHTWLLKLSVLLQGYLYLFWPALILRLLLLVVAAPPLGVRGLLALKVGLVIHPLLLFFCYHLLLLVTASKLRALWRVVKAPPIHSRRMLLAGSGALVLGTAGLVRTARELTIVRQSLSLKDLPQGLNGLKVALLADIHRGPATSQSYLLDVVEAVNALEPDVILMPGDFVSKSADYFADLSEGLKLLNPKIASFATLGNHDHWEGAEEAVKALEAAGVECLQNRHLYLTERRTLAKSSPSGLCLAGVDDYWCGKPDSDHLKQVAQNVPVILLSHNPDVCEVEKTQQHRVDFQVSGHTHGGQVVLPLIGPVATASHFGTKYLYGLNQGPKWPVYTTSGIGTSTIPVRVGTKPEIVLFQLSPIS